MCCATSTGIFSLFGFCSPAAEAAPETMHADNYTEPRDSHPWPSPAESSSSSSTSFYPQGVYLHVPHSPYERSQQSPRFSYFLPPSTGDLPSASPPLNSCDGSAHGAHPGTHRPPPPTIRQNFSGRRRNPCRWPPPTLRRPQVPHFLSASLTTALSVGITLALEVLSAMQYKCRQRPFQAPPFSTAHTSGTSVSSKLHSTLDPGSFMSTCNTN